MGALIPHFHIQPVLAFSVCLLFHFLFPELIPKLSLRNERSRNQHRIASSRSPFNSDSISVRQLLYLSLYLCTKHQNGREQWEEEERIRSPNHIRFVKRAENGCWTKSTNRILTDWLPRRLPVKIKLPPTSSDDMTRTTRNRIRKGGIWDTWKGKSTNWNSSQGTYLTPASQSMIPFNNTHHFNFAWPFRGQRYNEKGMPSVAAKIRHDHFYGLTTTTARQNRWTTRGGWNIKYQVNYQQGLYAQRSGMAIRTGCGMCLEKVVEFRFLIFLFVVFNSFGGSFFQLKWHDFTIYKWFNFFIK